MEFLSLVLLNEKIDVKTISVSIVCCHSYKKGIGKKYISVCLYKSTGRINKKLKRLVTYSGYLLKVTGYLQWEGMGQKEQGNRGWIALL